MKSFKVLVLGLGVFVAACSGDDGGECTDCVACPPSNPFTCTGDTICIDELCQPAFGRNYVFTVVSGTLPSMDEAGASWDEAGGLPDVFVELTVDGVPYATPVVVDSVTPAWNFTTPPVAISATTTTRVGVYDDDEPTDDGAWACTSNPLMVEFLRAGGLNCSGPGSLPGARVMVTVRPE
jgi:hypothetical protein